MKTVENGSYEEAFNYGAPISLLLYRSDNLGNVLSRVDSTDFLNLRSFEATNDGRYIF